MLVDVDVVGEGRGPGREGIGREEGGYHGEESPDGVGGLGAYTEPVLCARDIELDILDWLSFAVLWEAWDGVVGSDDFDWF